MPFLALLKRVGFRLGERLIYRPSLLGSMLCFTLFPLSLIYIFCLHLKRLSSKFSLFSPPIPSISVGNLSLGGSGKTPLCAAIANEFKGAAIILRGYARSSKGLVVVKAGKEVLADIKTAGDEAMLYTQIAPNSIIIVSANRKEAILKAASLGARYAILDDAFSKFNIKKLNLLIQPSPAPALPFCLPAGGWRYPKSWARYADMTLKKGVHFSSHSSAPQIDLDERVVLLCAIANPLRLEPFFRLCVGVELFEDHHSFSYDECEMALKKHKANTILCTQKDWVKLKDFKLRLKVIELKTKLGDELKEILHSYINSKI